jgi:hypothetical protein
VDGRLIDRRTVDELQLAEPWMAGYQAKIANDFFEEKRGEELSRRKYCQ